MVDDDRDATDSLALLLRLNGHEVEVAYSGPEAIASAPVFRPDVIFLDLGMPEMDGFSVAGRLRQQENVRAAFLVAVTGYGGEGERHRAAAAGFGHYFLKPVEFADLAWVMGLVAKAAGDPAG